MKTRTKVASIAAAALLATTAGAMAVVHNSKIALTAEEYTEILEPSATRIAVTANIEPVREVAINTHLTAPVDSVQVRVGDRVEAQQLLGALNTTALERELQTKQSSDAVAGASSYAQITAAQRDLAQLQESLDQNLNPEINGALQALHTAERQYQDTEIAYQQAAGRGSRTQAQEISVRQAREQVLAASIEAARVGITAEAGFLDGATAGTNLASAIANLNEQQHALEDALRDAGEELAQKQREVAAAFQAQTDAAVSLETTKLAIQHQLDNKSAAVNDAITAAQAQQQANAQANSSLQLDINSAEVRSPLKGVVTEVKAQTGQPASGGLFKIGDDTTLVLRGSIKESDANKVKQGQPVEFTTDATGDRRLRGKVTFISPVAESSAVEKTDQQQQPRSGYPVEITVEGDREGLRLGGKAKARIEIAPAAKTLTVPASAVWEEDGKQYVMVVDNGKVVAREVKVTDGTQVTGDGITAGTIVLNDASSRDVYLDQEVSL